MIKKVFFLFILFTGTNSVVAQGIEDWRVYPSYSTINALSATEEIIYAGTLGGIFRISDNQITTISNLDGLYRSNPTDIIYDEEYDRIYAGYLDGTIDVVYFDNSGNERLADIRRVNRFSAKGINDLQIDGNYIYIATQFGVVIYDRQSLVVEDSYVKLGDFDIGTSVNELLIVGDTLYAATEQGIAMGDITDNLNEAGLWQNFDISDGFNTNIISGIAIHQNKKYALNEGSVFEYENGNWVSSDLFTIGSVVKLKASESGNLIAAATTLNVMIVDVEGNSQLINAEMNSRISDFQLSEERLIIGTTNEGIIVFDLESNSSVNYLPSGPYLNFFNNLLSDGSTIAGTSTNEFPGPNPLNPVRGYYLYKENRWENFNRNTRSELSTIQTVFSVTQNDSSYYLGSWGHGIIKHDKDTDKITVYNRGNSNLTGIASNTNYVVISGIDSDSENNIWATSFLSEFPLFVKLSDSDDWIPFRGVSGNDNYYKLFIDSFDQKWISLITENNIGLGLLVMDTEDLTNSGDDRFVKLTSSPENGNLPDEKVTAIIQDKRNEVWIGTGRGIARFIFPELIIDGGANERQAQWLINEDTTAVSRFLLRDVNVSAMAVNDANQKWVGSKNQGLWLINEDGSRILKRFTVDNSSLISNTINSIVINNETGEVFISTDLGLTSYQDIPKAPVAEMDRLKVFPNPFQYSRHNRIMIEGLSDATRIKILGVDGFVVNELKAQGGRVSWDGYDYNGNQLGTGVYFVIAYEESGREKGTGKVVIVK